MDSEIRGRVKAKIFRYNPEVDLVPKYQTYEVQWEGKGNVLQLVKQIHDEEDRTLAFNHFACGYKFCNGCMMMINGKVAHACLTYVEPGDEFVIEPMQGRPVIRDLVVDFGRRISALGRIYEISRGTTISEVKAKK